MIATLAPRDDAAKRAAATYDAASDHYDELSFWERFGRRTVERLNLAAGVQVLDVASGSGASALPAAAIVGPSGRLVGVDIAEELLAKARAKAVAHGLANAEFRVSDFRDLPAAETFDAVVCVFAIFFVPDMAGALRALWEHVRPGGVLAITTCGPRFAEPANAAFWNAVGVERPDLVRGFHAWDRIDSVETLSRLFTEAGIGSVEIVPESAAYAIENPDAWWTFVLGSGYRATVEALGPEAAVRVRTANLAAIQDVREVETNVIYAVARKPAASK